MLACAPSFAQTTPDDAAAREYFERGRAAFDDADYEAALVYFRHAYRLSQRGELQYDIGVAASRLQREQEALEAFEHYLAEVEDPEREAEVQERIAALRSSLAEREATERALAEAVNRYPPRVSSKRVSNGAIVGGTFLGILGVAGVTAMGVGLARNGNCVRAVGGVCVVEQVATPGTIVWGTIGFASLAGAAVWIGVDAKRNKDRRRRVRARLSPMGLSLSGSF